jgi:hypothetical protein
MAKAIFAGEEIKKLSLEPIATIPTSFDAILPRFFKNFFMCNGPGCASDNKPQQKKIDKLRPKCGH